MAVTNEKALWALMQPELARDVPAGWLALVRERVDGLLAELETLRGDLATERNLPWPPPEKAGFPSVS